MGNQTSSEGLEGLERSIDVEGNARAQTHRNEQFQGYSANETANRQTVFPFNRQDIYHFPSLDEALRYNPNDILVQTGPSIENLANLYPFSFPEAVLIAEAPNAYGSAAQAAVEAYFSRLGESAPTTTPCQLPNLPFRTSPESLPDDACEAPHVIRPAPAWQMAFEPSTASLSITHLPIGDTEGPLGAGNRGTARTVTEPVRMPAAASSGSQLGTGARLSRPGNSTSTVAGSDPSPGQAAQRVLRVANLAVMRMDSFSSELSSEDLSEAREIGRAIRPGWKAASMSSRLASPPLQTAPTAAAVQVSSSMRSLVPRSAEPVVQAQVAANTLPPAEQARHISGYRRRGTGAMWLQDIASTGTDDVQAQQQQEQQRHSPSTAGGWVAIHDNAPQPKDGKNHSGSGGHNRGMPEQLYSRHNDNNGKNSDTDNVGAINAGGGVFIPSQYDVRSGVGVMDFEGNGRHAIRNMEGHREVYAITADEGTGSGGSGMIAIRTMETGTEVSNTDARRSGSDIRSGGHVMVSDGNDHGDYAGGFEGSGVLTECKTSNRNDDGPANIDGGGGLPQSAVSSRPKSSTLGRSMIEEDNWDGQDASGVGDGDGPPLSWTSPSNTMQTTNYLHLAEGSAPGLAPPERAISEALDWGGSVGQEEASTGAWRVPRGTWPMVADHHVDLSRLAWLRQPAMLAAGGLTTSTSAPGASLEFQAGFRRPVDPRAWRCQPLLRAVPPPLLPQVYQPTRHEFHESSPMQQLGTEGVSSAAAADGNDDRAKYGSSHQEASADVAPRSDRIRLQKLHTPFLAVQEQEQLLQLTIGSSSDTVTAAKKTKSAAKTAPMTKPTGDSLVSTMEHEPSRAAAGTGAAAILTPLPLHQASCPRVDWNVMADAGAGSTPDWDTRPALPQRADERAPRMQELQVSTGDYRSGPAHGLSVLPGPQTLLQTQQRFALPPFPAPRSFQPHAAIPAPVDEPHHPKEFLWGFLHTYSREASASGSRYESLPDKVMPLNDVFPKIGLLSREGPTHPAETWPMASGGAVAPPRRQAVHQPYAAHQPMPDDFELQNASRRGVLVGEKVLAQRHAEAAPPAYNAHHLDDNKGNGVADKAAQQLTRSTSKNTVVKFGSSVLPPLPPAALPLPPVPGQWLAGHSDLHLEGIRPGPPSASAPLDQPMRYHPMSAATAPAGRTDGDGAESSTDVSAALLRDSSCPRGGDSWTLPMSHLQAELSWASSGALEGLGAFRQRTVGGVPSLGRPAPSCGRRRSTSPAGTFQPGQGHRHPRHHQQQLQGNTWQSSESEQFYDGPPQVHLNVNVDASSLRDVFQQCLQAAVPAVCAAAAAAAVLGQGALQAAGADNRDLPREGAASAAVLGSVSLQPRSAPHRSTQPLETGPKLSLVSGIGPSLGCNVSTQTQSPPRDQAVQTEVPLLPPPQPESLLPPPPPSLLGQESAAAATRPAQEVPSPWTGFTSGVSSNGAHGGVGTGPLRSSSPAHSDMLRRTAMLTPAVAPAAGSMGGMTSVLSGAWRSQAPLSSVGSSPDKSSTAEAEGTVAARLGAGNARERGGGKGLAAATSSLRGSLSLKTLLSPSRRQLPTTMEPVGSNAFTVVTSENVEEYWQCTPAVGEAVATPMLMDKGPIFHSQAAASLFEECRREIHKRAATGPPGLGSAVPTSVSGVLPAYISAVSSAGLATHGIQLHGENQRGYAAGLPELKRRKLSPLRPVMEYGTGSYGVMASTNGMAAVAPPASALLGGLPDTGPFARQPISAVMTRAGMAEALNLNPVLLRYAPPSLVSLERQSCISVNATPHTAESRSEPEVWLQQSARANLQPGGHVPDLTELPEDMVLGFHGERWGLLSVCEGLATAEAGQHSDGNGAARSTVSVARYVAGVGSYRQELGTVELSEQTAEDAGADARLSLEQVASPMHTQTHRSEMLLRFLNGLDQRSL